MSRTTTPTATLEEAPDPRDTLDAAIDAARLANPVIELPHGRRFIFQPDGYRLEAAHDPHALPPHIVQRLTVDDRASLSAYANRFSGPSSILIADLDALAIHAALDWHADNADELTPGPRRHTATLQLRPSEEFARWDAFEGERHQQAEFASFLEENAVDVVDPDPAVLIEVSRDLEATQGVSFKSSTRLESGDRAFTYETETHTRGDLKIPREFQLEIPLFFGEDTVRIRAALRWKVGGNGLLLGFEWRRVEYQRQACFRTIARTAAEETGLPVFHGRDG